jgi:hypothetical protein
VCVSTCLSVYLHTTESSFVGFNCYGNGSMCVCLRVYPCIYTQLKAVLWASIVMGMAVCVCVYVFIRVFTHNFFTCGMCMCVFDAMCS